MGTNGRKRILLFVCAGLLALAWTPQMRIQAQEPARTQNSLGEQGAVSLPDGLEVQEPAWLQSGFGTQGDPGAHNTVNAQTALPDGPYLTSWQNMADTFSAHSAAFWQMKEAELAASGRLQEAAFVAEKKAETAAGVAALQDALNRLAAVQNEGEETRIAARQEVERAAEIAMAQFAESCGQLLAMLDGAGNPDASAQPGEAAGTQPGETGTAQPEDGSSLQPTGTGATQPGEGAPSQPDSSIQPGEAPAQNPFIPGALAGKKVSILGDSITTFCGYIPEGYTCFYPREESDLTDVNDTWWMKVINRTGMQLLVNGSYSGSAVCGDSRAENSSAGCSNRRLVELMGADGTVPDVILVYLGANDFFHPMNLGSWSGQATHRTDHYILDFTEGYELMIQKLQAIYPGTKIYCMTLIEANSEDHPRVNANGDTIADYNRRIKEIAGAHGIPVIDVHECGMPVYELNRYTSDGTHPNREGAEKMAAYVTAALLAAN